jgi:hypothetical protein
MLATASMEGGRARMRSVGTEDRIRLPSLTIRRTAPQTDGSSARREETTFLLGRQRSDYRAKSTSLGAVGRPKLRSSRVPLGAFDHARCNRRAASTAQIARDRLHIHARFCDKHRETAAADKR